MRRPVPDLSVNGTEHLQRDPVLTYSLELLHSYGLDVPDVDRQVPEGVCVPGNEDEPSGEAPEGPGDG